MNCDTRLAINLRMFNLGENDEFIFAIKNYSYTDSPYVFLFRARKSDMNEDGEVIFKITPESSKYLKPGAFYNFSVLHNAFDPREETEYKKLTDNGSILIEYGAQDLVIPKDKADIESEITGVRLEPITNSTDLKANGFMGEITGMHLELLEE
jgi:hypothetical protein